MRMRLWILTCWLVACGTFGVVMPARAQTDDERARDHFEAGRSYYDQARYDDAAREFQQSFDLSERPELLLNLSQAQERALHYDAAIAAAQRYVGLFPDAKDRKTVEDRIANLQLLKQRFEEGGPAPLPPPGATAGMPGAQATPGTPGAASTHPAQPSAAGAPAAPELAQGSEPRPLIDGQPSEPTNRFTVPAIVLMGTGGAALVASLVTGLVAHADYKSLDRQCSGGACRPSAQDELDQGKTLSVLSTVLTVVGVLAAGSGATLLVLGGQKREQPEPDPLAARLRVAPGPGLASLRATLSF